MIYLIPDILLHIFHYVDKLSLITKIKLISKDFHALANYQLIKYSTKWEITFAKFNNLRTLRSSQFSQSMASRYIIDYDLGLIFYLSIDRITDASFNFNIDMSHIFNLKQSLNIYSTNSDYYSEYYLAEIPSIFSKDNKTVKFVIFGIFQCHQIALDYSDLNEIKTIHLDSSINRLPILVFSNMEILEPLAKYIKTELNDLPWRDEILSDVHKNFYLRSVMSQDYFMFFSLPHGIVINQIDQFLNKTRNELLCSYPIWTKDIVVFKNNTNFVGIRYNHSIKLLNLRTHTFYSEFYEVPIDFDPNRAFYLITHKGKIRLVLISNMLYILKPHATKHVTIPLEKTSTTTIKYFDDRLGIVFVKDIFNGTTLRSIDVIRVINK